MHRRENTEVLVVGAGPVGMVAALCLAEAGVGVTLIDEAWRTAAHSYACALHPSTLELLARLRLIDEVLRLGRRVDTLAFYDGPTRRAEVSFGALGGEFPFLVVLPQSDLEGLLERRLAGEAGAPVNWNHQLGSLRTEGDIVVAAIDKLGGTSLGYIVPHWETIVTRTVEARAAFVVGADGHNSFVRRALGIEYAPVGEPELFVVYEFKTDADLGAEARVICDATSTSVLWPLPGHRCRWTFQVPHSPEAADLPPKDRRGVWFAEPSVEEKIRHRIKLLIRERAPWFAGQISQISWLGHAQFERRLARRFGLGRCWLAGDAGHQTGPVGAQSLNVGLHEAELLAQALQKVLRERAPVRVLEAYDRQRQDEWRRLLGLKDGWIPRPGADPWVAERAGRILSCLPASGEHLIRLATQLGLPFQ